MTPITLQERIKNWRAAKQVVLKTIEGQTVTTFLNRTDDLLKDLEKALEPTPEEIKEIFS